MSSNLADRERMNQLIEQIDLEIEYDKIPIPTPLCKCHYYTIYNLIQPQQNNCPTCGVNLKHVTSRPCPNAEVVKDHLQKNTAFKEHHQAFTDLYPSCNITPKLHYNMVHYPHWISRYWILIHTFFTVHDVIIIMQLWTSHQVLVYEV